MKQLLIMKIWIWWEKQKPQKLKKTFSPRRILFGTSLSFYISLSCSFFLQFWHSVSFVKDYSVLVGRHTHRIYMLIKLTRKNSVHKLVHKDYNSDL